LLFLEKIYHTLKNRLFLLLAITVSFSACQKPSRPVAAAYSADYKKGVSLLYRKNDSAFYYFNRVVTSPRDSLQTAMAYNYMALIQSDAGDYFGGQESLLTSLKFLDTTKEKDHVCLSSDYNELGLTSINLKHFDEAVTFFDQALLYAKEQKFRLALQNNKALAYQKKGNYTQALKLYRSTIVQVTRKETYARVLSNMARTKWLADPGYYAAPELYRALRIRQTEKDSWGENASYAHLADYYTHSRPDSALRYAIAMYAVARRLESPDDQLEALQKLIRLAPPRDTKPYFARYQQLSDSLQTARNAAKNQFALIRYDAEKNKAENLKLQKDNTEKRYQLIQQNVRFYGALSAFIVLTVIAVLWYRKRKQRQEQETQEAVRETQRKASKKVHDTLANDIYRIMKIVQHEPALDKDALVDDIDEVYQRARDISYEITQSSDEHFHEKISALLKSFATEDIKVVLVGNSKELWQKVDNLYKPELKYILQELMVNMQKHSRADNVVIRFALKSSRCHISYVDNGIGIPNGTPQKNGLENTGNRIKGIGGQITFDSDAGKGLQIQIAFPTS
jgi:signal transduction histidine kinase